MKHFKLTFDRALARGTKWQLLIIGGIIFFSILLSYALLSFSGDWETFCQENNINKFMLPLYLLIDQNLYNEIYLGTYNIDGSTTIGYGKWIAFASGITFLIGCIFFNGAIIAILSNFITRRVEDYENGTTHYLKAGHYIILGYDDMVPSIIRYLLNEDPKADILLLSSAPAQFIQEKLRETVARKYMDNIIINYGHRTSIDYYKDIHLEKAKQLFVVGDRRKPQHDAVNVECVENICAYLKAHQPHTVKSITCVFEDLDTYASFRTTDIFTDITNELGVTFIPYNFYTGWAHRVFVHRSYIGNKPSYPYLYKRAIGPTDEHHVHLVFVGMSNFAVTFANEAAHILHFTNFQKARTRITFIDLKADREMSLFITRNHHFFEIQPFYYGDYTASGDKKSNRCTSYLQFKDKNADFLDIDFEFIKGDVFTRDIQDLLCEWAHDEKQYLSVFLAMANQRDNFAIAMNMPDAIYNNEIPIFVRQDSSDNFITHLREADAKAPRKGDPEYRTYTDGVITRKETHGRYAHIYPFGMNESAFFSSPVALKRAKLINYLYSTADYSTNEFTPLTALAALSQETVWDKANEKWKERTVAEKWSNLYFAYGIDTKLLALRAMRELEMDNDVLDEQPLTPEEIYAIGITEHNRWNVEKLLMGYRKPKESEDKYNKDEETAKALENNKSLFIHHDIRPFEEIKRETQKLDFEFAKYIPWILSMSKENE